MTTSPLQYDRDELIAEVLSLRAEVERLRAALRDIKAVQPKVLAYMRREEFKFETPLDKPDADRTVSERWEKLAFSIYSDLCEVDAIADGALTTQEEYEFKLTGGEGAHLTTQEG